MKKSKVDYCLNIKRKVFDQYGKICECCGETNINILTIDHINGGGRKHRLATTKRGGYNFYLWLIKNNYPTGFRVLCSNCNMAIGHHGFCPHKCQEKNINECQFCLIKLNNSNYMEFYKKYSLNICMQCVFTFSSNKKNIDKSWISYKKYALLDKQLVVENYGGICKSCNENNPLFLTIDHINTIGNIERKDGKIGVIFYRYLKHNNYPTSNYQLLCYNCNCNKIKLKSINKTLNGD